MSVHITERAVRTDVGQVAVRDADGGIQVRWFCGETRLFEPAAVKQHLKHLEFLEDHPDVWLTVKDSRRESLALRVEDGELHAANVSTDWDGDSVPFRDLRKAIKRVIRERR